MSDDSAISPSSDIQHHHRNSAVNQMPRYMQQDTHSSQQAFLQRPPSVAFAESDNSDAMALRAAISVLQMQRDKSKRDLQTLEKIKLAATQQPELFAKELASGTLRQEASHSDPLRATFESDSEEEGDDDEEVSSAAEPVSNFPKIPSMQNVFRTPHVNWAQYSIVGDSLDKMHEEQRSRPSQGEGVRGSAVPERAIAAPYSPFTDKPPAQQQQQPPPGRRASHRPA